VAIPLRLGTGALHSLPDALLPVWFVGLEDGDATRVQTPSGQRLLIDVGRGKANVAAAVNSALSGWSRRLHLSILTHGDADRMAPLQDLREALCLEQPWYPQV